MLISLQQGEFILYQTDEGQAGLDVRLIDETVWLTQAQMQELLIRLTVNLLSETTEE